MSSKGVFILLVIVLITSIDEGYALKCYECSSMFSVNCADPFIPIPLDPGTECVSFDENGPKCSKIERCMNGTKRYIRRCRDDNHDMAGDEIHYCSSDFCNSAIKNGPITVTATIATSIVMMLVALKLF